MEERLRSLHGCVPENEEEAKNIIFWLGRYFQRELTTEERELALHTFFQEEYGISSFLRQVAGNKKFTKISVEVLQLLTFLVEYLKEAVDQYVGIIKATCLSCVLRSSSSAQEKEKALDALIVIIQSGPWTPDLELSTLMSNLRTIVFSRPSKASSTVLRRVYTLMGVLSEFYPHDVYDQADRVLAALLAELEHQTSAASKVEFIVVEGCFEGLAGFLHSFSKSPSDDPTSCRRIVEYIRKLVNCTEVQKRTAQKAALKVLALHGAQFATHLASDYCHWHESLCHWLSYGVEEQNIARQALLTFYQEVANFSWPQGQAQDVLSYFMTYFKRNIQESFNMEVCIKGFGLFAKACKIHQPEEIPSMFNLLSQMAELLPGGDMKHKLANYLESLVAIVVEMGEVNSLEISILEGISVQLIVQYAVEEHSKRQYMLQDALINTVILLNQCRGTVLDTYLKTVVYQGTLRSVSHLVAQDADILQDAGQKVITFRNYLPFWQNFLSLELHNRKNYALGVSLSEKKSVSQKVFDEMIESVLCIISKLDLTVKEREDLTSVTEAPLCDPERALVASHPRDFAVLVNVVDFVTSLLSTLQELSSFEKWVYPLSTYLVKMSTQNPLISSFYKFLATVLLLSDKIGYFERDEEEMQDPEWRLCVAYVSAHLQEVIERQVEYKGDLQVACLRLILATPPPLVGPLLSDVSPVFQAVFRLGYSMLSLAREGLHTLRRWSEDLRAEKVKPLLVAVLPSFDDLLRTKDVSTSTIDDNESMDVRKAVSLRKKNKNSTRLKVQEHEETELLQFQREVLLFLATLDNDVCTALLDGSEERAEMTVWQKERFLRFFLPFPDMKPAISFDALLPQLMDLSQSCGNRQTRGSACELLQAVVMFMIGTDVQLEGMQKGQLTPQWEKLFPVLLRLGCDSDLMVHQLFRPLGEQLAHWYSSKNQMKSQQSAAFLNALLDGVTHESDAALRDYASVCLHEYVLWSHKQGDGFLKMEPLLKQISSLCRHPSSHKRMGAALAFNSMYRELREEPKVITVFWLEMLHSLVTALTLCPPSEANSHTIQQGSQALLHIQRVLIERKVVFNSESVERRCPTDFHGTSLYDAVRWLLRQCTALNADCRHNCMSLISRVSPHISDICSVKDLVKKVVDLEGEGALLDIAEGDCGLEPSLPSRSPWNKAFLWLHALLASLDCYLWLMEEKVAPVQHLLALPNANVLQVIKHFVTNTTNWPVRESALWRPRMIEDINVAKCTCVVRTVDFLSAVVNLNFDLPDEVWNDSMWHLITHCILCPSHVGFNPASKEVEVELPKTMRKLLNALVEHCDPSKLLPLRQTLAEYIGSRIPDLIKSFPQSIWDDKVDPKNQELVSGFTCLLQVFKDPGMFPGLSHSVILHTVFNAVVKKSLSGELRPVTIGPATCAYARKFLQLAFLFSDEVKPLLELTCCSTPLHRAGLQGGIMHGEHFVLCFGPVIIERLLQKPKQCVAYIIDNLTPCTSHRTLVALPTMLDDSGHTYVGAVMRENVFELACGVCKNWRALAAWAADQERKEWLVSLLVLIMKWNTARAGLDVTAIAEWILEQLTCRSHSLPFKTRVIALLPLVLLDGSKKDQLKTALQGLKDQHFPLRSSELVAGSEQHVNFVHAFEGLLNVMVTSGSPLILQSVIKMTASDAKHSCLHMLPTKLEAFMTGLRRNEQVEVLSNVFNVVMNNGLVPDIRLCVLNHFLLVLLRKAPGLSLATFGESIIQQLFKIVGDRAVVRDNAKGEQKIVSSICCWNVLQQIFSHPSKSLIEGKGSLLVKAVFPNAETGKELVQFITKRAYEILNTTPDQSWSEAFQERHRIYLCATYNTIATLVCNLKRQPSDEQMYTRLLFKESSNRFLWRNLMNNKKTYLKPYEYSQRLKHVKQVVSIRREARSARKSEDGVTNYSQSLNLSQSQSYFAGTLESDITRFDFSHSKVSPRVQSSAQEPQDEQSNMEVDEFDMEMDSINEHECMPTLCGIVRHLVDSNITPKPTEGAEMNPPPLPSWMTELKNSMEDPSCPHKACIFLLKLIFNCESYFLPYAEHWAPVIMKCAVRHCLQFNISYLLIDLVCLLVKWSPKTQVSLFDKQCVSKLLHFLIENCHHRQQEVFRLHIEVIKSVVDVWKDAIEVPKLLMHDLLRSPDGLAGINLTAVMLMNGILPWDSQSKSAYLSTLASHLQDKRKDVYKVCAETLGLALKCVTTESDMEASEENGVFLAFLNNTLKNIHSKQNDHDRFLTVLYAIHENYPPIVDAFINTILHYVAQTSDEMKAVCLCLINARLDAFNSDPFEELKQWGILKFLKNRNIKVQVTTLQIISKLAPGIPCEDLVEIIQALSEMQKEASRELRQIIYNVATYTYDLCTSKEGKLTDNEKTILEKSKAVLLLGLVDPDLELQTSSFKIWSAEERLPHNASERLLALLSQLYSPSTEQYFLSYSVQLMLEETANTPDYESVVFQHALSDCPFEDYQVLSSWRAKNAPVAPLFAETYASQIRKSETFSESMNDSFRLLATQGSLLFQPTAALSENEQTDNIPTGSPFKSSLLFDHESYSTSQTKSRSYKQGVGFGSRRLQPNSVDAVDGEESASSEFKYRRYKGKSKTGYFCAMANVRRSKQREEIRKERTQKREGQVALFRKYRTGDLPDIQLKTADFIRPLKDLVKRDAMIARQVFVSLFVGVCDLLPDQQQRERYKSKVSKHLMYIFGESEANDSAFVGSLFDVALKYELQLDAALVSAASRNSGQLSLGILLLEANLMSYRLEEEDEEVWLQLARLYETSGERDVVRAIIQHKVGLGTTANQALSADSEGNWKEAKHLYYQALEETQVDNFYEAYFECLARLSEWGDMNKTIRELVSGDVNKLWEDPWHEEKILPHLIRSEVLEIIRLKKDTHEFIKDLNTWLLEPERGSLIKSRFSEELSVLCLIKKNIPQAQFYASQRLFSFLDDWGDLNLLSTNLRQSRLLEVLCTAEILLYLSELKKASSEEEYVSILNKLERTKPSGSDSLKQWEFRMNYRIGLMGHLSEAVQMQTTSLTCDMLLSLVDTALHQHNHVFAKKYLEIVQPKAKSCGSVLTARWLVARCRERHQWSATRTQPAQRLLALLQIWDQLKDVVMSKDLDDVPDLSVATHGADSDLACSVKAVLEANPDTWDVLKRENSDICNKLADRLRTALNSQSSYAANSEVIEALEEMGLMSLNHAVVVAKTSSKKDESHGKEVAAAYLKVAEYCRRMMDASSYEPQQRLQLYSKPLMKAVLSAMQYGSAEARQLFPLLLQLPDLSTDLCEDFRKKSLLVPKWMYLGWIPQILALLDTPAVDALSPLLSKLAEKYPNALLYPYNISRKNLRLNDTARERASSVLQVLDRVVEGRQEQMKLIQALSSLCFPSVIVKHSCDQVHDALRSSTVNWDGIQKICQVLLTETLPAQDECSGRNVSPLHGKLFQDTLILQIRQQFEALSNAATKMNIQVFTKILREINGLITKLGEKEIKYSHRGILKVKDFSPWLSNFIATKQRVEIEIPGQYTGDEEPSLLRHVYISQFGENVQVMSSLRKPVKLTIIGSDTKSYNFLVKFGEDLRQDERVQQMLGLMNKMFQKDQYCRRSHLSIKTYKVMPLSSCLGVIEWVDNTCSLDHLMTFTMTVEEKSARSEAHVAMREWIFSSSKEARSSREAFGNAYIKRSREESIQAFRTQVNAVPMDILRRGIMTMSSSYEAFYTLRHHFITSYSTLCVAHWILGIGDRHLGNCLVSQKDCRCIGIDFGHAFGTATQFLPVPELVPFRLTPHIVSLMHPLDDNGLVKESMVHCLQALRAEPELLIATMQVFILEPTLDWLVWSSKQAQAMGETGHTASTWLPKLKVQQARKKLEGINPLYIVAEDLEHGHQNFPHLLEGYLYVLSGDVHHNIRARLERGGLTPRQQVECLIDLAMDYNVLSKSWSGWQAWM